MHFLRLSLQASFCLLSLPFSDARGIGNRLADRLRGIKQRDICVEDDWYSAISSRDDRTAFCSQLYMTPNATSTIYYTPTTTSINIKTTSTVTLPGVTRVTATSTVVSTTIAIAQQKIKRAPAPTARAILKGRATAADLVDAVANEVFADGAASSNNPYPASVISDISSACSCLDFGPLFTDTTTLTEAPYTKVQTAFTRTTTFPLDTLTIQTQTITITTISSVWLGASIPPPSSVTTSTSTLVVSHVPAPSPTGQNYTCPKDDKTTQGVVIDDQVYEYKVFCNSTFSNETAYSVQPAGAEGDCLALCTASDNVANSPVCKGFSFNGTSCSLYQSADSKSLVTSNEFSSAVLSIVSGRNSTFQNRSPGAFTSVTSTISGITLITPPPVVSGTSFASSSCFTSTYTDTASVVRWTEACSWTSSWYSSWAQSATIIYSSQEVIEGSGGGANNASGGGAGGASSSGASGIISNGVTSTFVSASATSGFGGEANATGGEFAPSATTFTITLPGTTIISVSTYASSEAGGGGNATGGAGGSGGGSGASSTGTGGELNGTTIEHVSTSVSVTSFATSGGEAGSTGTGGVISSVPWNYSSSITVISSATSGATGSSSGTEGIITPPSSNFTSTIETNSTSTWLSTGATSGATSSFNGTGGTLPGTAPLSGNISSTTFFSAATNVSLSTTTSVTSSATSEETGGTIGTGGIITPTSNGTFSRSRTEDNRSGTGSPPSSTNATTPVGTAPSGTAPTIMTYPSGAAPTGYSSLPVETWSSPPGWNFTTPIPYPSGTGPLGTAPPGTAPFSTPTEAGTSGWPTPSTNGSFSRSTTEKPRSGTATPPSGTSAWPIPSPNSTWLGETYPPTSTPTPTPSGSPSPSINSTFCATVTARETITETVFTSSSGCICATTSYNTFPWGGYGPIAGGPTAPVEGTTTISSTSTAEPILSFLDLRQPGKPATSEQIDSSCKNIGNQIFNGEFEIQDAQGEPLGWGFSTDSTEIMLLDFQDSTQHTDGGSYEARVVSEDVTATAMILQPLTLCPNATYTIGAWTRQLRVLAECTGTFSINGTILGTVSPGQTWGSGISNLKSYTAGPTFADANVDFEITVACVGSEDAQGNMVIDFDDLELAVVM